MRFAHPDAFWLLIGVALAAVLVWRSHRVRQHRLAALADAALLAPLVAESSSSRRLARQILAWLGMVLCVVALARPQAGTRVELEKTHGVNVVLALDVSRSMLARDVRPDRLRRAQAELADLMEQLRGHRVGLVAFAGVAYAPCPLTTDIGAAKMFLRSLNPDAVPQGGTAIARALATARALFNAEKRGTGEGGSSAPGASILVLVTDGEDHEGELETEAAALKEDGIQLYAVGVGSPLGEPIPLSQPGSAAVQYLKDANGQTVLTRLDEAGLQKLAQDAGGQYISGVEGGLELEKVRLGIAATQKAELESRLVVQYAERFQWVLGPAVAALVMAVALGLKKPSRRTRVQRAAQTPTAAGTEAA